MKKPQSLKKGSVVRIISTARKITPADVSPSIKLLKSWGLTVELGRNIYAQENQFAGTIEQRYQDLQEALDDEHVDMIWCSRGGYGTTMLLDRLNFDKFILKPKWVVVYSDITSLLCHVTSSLNVASVHATMPINVNDNIDENGLKSINSLKEWLFGGVLQYPLMSSQFTRLGNAMGPIIGGNLSIIYSILGSRSSPNTSGHILFIEDLDEYLYHVDRMMVNLKRNGILTGLAGMIVGGLTDMNDNTIPYGKSAVDIVLEHVQDYNYPVYFGFDAGHMSPNLTLPFGVEAQIKNNQLTIKQ